MPGPALHLRLAGDVLASWAAAPVRAPFMPSPPTRNAFLHGAIAPDMGYFPGADPLLAQLAHHARTGAFCRALTKEARTEAEEAFAWGWVTHVLADVAIHPLVNDACGELLTGARTPVWGEAVSREHLRVEMGLDAATGAARHAPALRALPPHAFAVLERAYRVTFGVAPPGESLAKAHRCMTRCLGPLGWWRAVAGRAVRSGGGARAAAAVLRVMGAACPAASHARALLSPVPPSRWLVREVEEIVAAFPEWVDTHLASDLRFLRDHCLDTGEVRDADGPCAREAIAGLQERAGEHAGPDDPFRAAA